MSTTTPAASSSNNNNNSKLITTGLLVNEDVASSSKEFVAQTEFVVSSYKRGTKANELSMKTQRSLVDITTSLTRGNQAINELENAPDVMKSHSVSANAAKFQVIQSAKAMSDCHHRLLAAWGHVTGAREQ